MSWLNKLPDLPRTPSGLEWPLFKKLPHIALAGTIIAGLTAGFARWWPMQGSASEIAAQIQIIDILAIAFVTLHLTAVFTVAVGCVVVMVMKGPGYVADGYDLSDAEQPKEQKR